MKYILTFLLFILCAVSVPANNIGSGLNNPGITSDELSDSNAVLQVQITANADDITLHTSQMASNAASIVLHSSQIASNAAFVVLLTAQIGTNQINIAAILAGTNGLYVAATNASAVDAAAKYVQLTETGDTVTIDAANVRTNTFGGAKSIGGAVHQDSAGTASGTASHADSYGKAYATADHADSFGTATGGYSHADSYGTASGDKSHADSYAYARGNYSHADSGGQTTGTYSHADSRGVAVGDYSHANSSGSAFGNYSFASGVGARTLHANSFVWSDGNITTSTVSEQVTFHATGGIRLLGGPISGNASSLTNMDLSTGIGNAPVAVITNIFGKGIQIGAWADNFVLKYDAATGVITNEADAGAGGGGDTNVIVLYSGSTYTGTVTLKGGAISNVVQNSGAVEVTLQDTTGSGGSGDQTPWTNAVDGAGYGLFDADYVSLGTNTAPQNTANEWTISATSTKLYFISPDGSVTNYQQ